MMRHRTGVGGGGDDRCRTNFSGSQVGGGVDEQGKCSMGQRLGQLRRQLMNGKNLNIALRPVAIQRFNGPSPQSVVGPQRVSVSDE